MTTDKDALVKLTPERTLLAAILDTYASVLSPEMCATIDKVLLTAPAEAPVERATRKVYKKADEHASYAHARFVEGAASALSFEWQGKRYRYLHTDFDETGDFDLLLTAAATTPPRAEAEVPREPTENDGIALNTGHPKAGEAADAFWQYWRENGETHRHGYYESTWGAINRALQVVGVVRHDYETPRAMLDAALSGGKGNGNAD